MGPGRRRYRLLALATCALARTLHAQPPAFHCSDLLADPAAFQGREVEVDVVESLQAVKGYGVCVSAPETVGCALALVPKAFDLADAGRYSHELDQPIAPPVRVRGELLSDEEAVRTTHIPAWRFRVSSVDPLPPDAATRFGSVDELLAQKERWDRRMVTVEGSWRKGFETSVLDSRIWVATRQDAEIVGNSKGKQPPEGRRVRITGLLFAGPKGHYGHMGTCPMLVVASRIEYLGSHR